MPMGRYWPWHHFWSYHLWDWIDLLTANPAVPEIFATWTVVCTSGAHQWWHADGCFTPGGQGVAEWVSHPRWFSKCVLAPIHGFPRFGSKDLSNPKDDKTKNDAMVGVYPLECPKHIIPLKQIENSRKSVKSGPKSKISKNHAENWQ